MRCGLQCEAFTAIAGRDRRARIAALQHQLRRLEIEAALFCRLAMAGETIVAQERQHLAFEINGRAALEWRDGNARSARRRCAEQHGEKVPEQFTKVTAWFHFCLLYTSPSPRDS